MKSERVHVKNPRVNIAQGFKKELKASDKESKGSYKGLNAAGKEAQAGARDGSDEPILCSDSIHSIGILILLY